MHSSNLPPHRLEPSRGAVREWADLEGKSATMSEDLQRRYAAPRIVRRKLIAALAPLIKLVALTIEAVRMIRSD